MKTLVIGLGNTIAGDDGVGIQVVRGLKSKINKTNINIVETYYSGLKLIDLMYGYNEVIIIDAFKNGSGKSGEIKLFDLNNEQFSNNSSLFHGQNFVASYKNLRRKHSDIPKSLKIIGVSVDSVSNYGEDISTVLKAKLPQITEKIANIIRS